MNKKDLVALCYASNNCYTTVLPLDKVEGVLEIDVKRQMWRYGTSEFKIGQMRHVNPGCRDGVIGIYDRTNIRHLDSMVHHAQEATSERGSVLDD